MLQPSCHPNSTLCTVTVHQSLVESILEKGWGKNRSFLGLSSCQLQALLYQEKSCFHFILVSKYIFCGHEVVISFPQWFNLFLKLIYATNMLNVPNQISGSIYMMALDSEVPGIFRLVYYLIIIRHCQKNSLNCLQLTCSMLQPSCHPNSTCWSNNRSFLGVSVKRGPFVPNKAMCTCCLFFLAWCFQCFDGLTLSCSHHSFPQLIKKKPREWDWTQKGDERCGCMKCFNPGTEHQPSDDEGLNHGWYQGPYNKVVKFGIDHIFNHVFEYLWQSMHNSFDNFLPKFLPSKPSRELTPPPPWTQHAYNNIFFFLFFFFSLFFFFFVDLMLDRKEKDPTSKNAPFYNTLLYHQHCHCLDTHKPKKKKDPIPKNLLPLT
ncbi:hypothetical protein VP01_337g1 [Puccinia sorghi]|uniref:Uncharacterized protein n=1 Tax=Puccinia sorghi TaxID=27349 RepID=A0A0L6UWU8_9BASI|nr:hypothetical protein VP01_337g1 [Puccinia sorghi]